MRSCQWCRCRRCNASLKTASKEFWWRTNFEFRRTETFRIFDFAKSEIYFVSRHLPKLNAKGDAVARIGFCLAKVFHNCSIASLFTKSDFLITYNTEEARKIGILLGSNLGSSLKKQSLYPQRHDLSGKTTKILLLNIFLWKLPLNSAVKFTKYIT